MEKYLPKFTNEGIVALKAVLELGDAELNAL
jgi:hypothetical protein